MAITKVIEYEDEEYHVELTLRRATVRQGFVRTRLINKAMVGQQARTKAEPDKALSMEDLQESFVTTYTYPACMGALVELKNLGEPTKQLSGELTLEEFLELPDTLVYQWEEGAYELNPHWVPQPVGEEAKTTEGKDSEPSSRLDEVASTE